MIETDFTAGLTVIDLAYVSWLAGALLLVTALLWLFAETHFQHRRAMLANMTRFGGRFIREFERPLSRQRSGDRPIRSRLRFAPHQERVDVLLAPNAGHSYPNLSDHRKNLDYDIERVLQVLGDEPFVRGRLYEQDPWVVIPFQVKAGSKQEGVK